jgi:Putative prokaryotic signal transducing protein
LTRIGPFSSTYRLTTGLPQRCFKAYHGGMEELLRSNNPVTLSFVESLMREAGIGVLVADQNMSIVEGSLGIIPRRILVESDRIEHARRIVRDAGLENELGS